MKVLAEIGQRIQGYFAEADRQAKEAYDLRYKSSESIAGFEFHRPSCTKTGPLEPVSEDFVFPSGGGWGGGMPYVYIRCVECKGSENDKEK